MKICVCGNENGFGGLIGNLLKDNNISFFKNPKKIKLNKYDVFVIIGSEKDNYLKDKKLFCIENGEKNLEKKIMFVDCVGNLKNINERKEYWDKKNVKYFYKSDLNSEELKKYIENEE